MEYLIEDPLGGNTAGPPLWESGCFLKLISIDVAEYHQNRTKIIARKLTERPETTKTDVYLRNLFKIHKKFTPQKFFRMIFPIFMDFLGPGRDPKILEKSQKSRRKASWNGPKSRKTEK